MSAVKRKEIENNEDSNGKRVKHGSPTLILSSQLNNNIIFEITSKSTSLGRNTQQLKTLINNDKFVSRESCSIVASDDSLSAILSAKSLNPLRVFQKDKPAILLNKGQSIELMPGDSFEMFCNASTLVGAYPFILSVEGEIPTATDAGGLQMEIDKKEEKDKQETNNKEDTDKQEENKVEETKQETKEEKKEEDTKGEADIQKQKEIEQEKKLCEQEKQEKEEQEKANKDKEKAEEKEKEEKGEEEDKTYIELVRKLNLEEEKELKSCFDVLWSEGFTTAELLSEVTAIDLEELNIDETHRKQLLSNIRSMWEKEESSQATIEPSSLSRSSSTV